MPEVPVSVARVVSGVQELRDRNKIVPAGEVYCAAGLAALLLMDHGLSVSPPPPGRGRVGAGQCGSARGSAGAFLQRLCSRQNANITEGGVAMGAAAPYE